MGVTLHNFLEDRCSPELAMVCQGESRSAPDRPLTSRVLIFLISIDSQRLYCLGFSHLADQGGGQHHLKVVSSKFQSVSLPGYLHGDITDIPSPLNPSSCFITPWTRMSRQFDSSLLRGGCRSCGGSRCRCCRAATTATSFLNSGLHDLTSSIEDNVDQCI
jgi:hypothetical protein